MEIQTKMRGQRPPAVNQVDGIAGEDIEREDGQRTDQAARNHENGDSSNFDKLLDGRVPRTAEMLDRGVDGTVPLAMQPVGEGGRQRPPGPINSVDPAPIEGVEDAGGGGWRRQQEAFLNNRRFENDLAQVIEKPADSD